MTVEVNPQYPSDLNASYPAASDAIPEGDDHIRNLKTVLKTTFPNIAGPVTPTQTELNYVDGVTSAIQTQLDAKGAITGQTWTGTHAFPATTSIGNVSATELGYLDGVTSGIQAQINALGSSGALIPLSTVTAAASASMDIETTFNSTYDAYLIVVTSLVPSSSSSTLLTMKVGGSYAASAYSFHTARFIASSTVYNAAAGTAQASINISGQVFSGHANFVIYVYNPAGTSLSKSVAYDGVMVTSADVLRTGGSGLNTSTSALTGIRLAQSAGTITSGKARLYGIRNS